MFACHTPHSPIRNQRWHSKSCARWVKVTSLVSSNRLFAFQFSLIPVLERGRRRGLVLVVILSRWRGVADHFKGTRLPFFANFTTERQSPNTPHHAELQEILGYRFANPWLLDEATLTRGGGSSVTPQNAHGNKPLALVGDALIRLDVGVRSYAEGTGTGKHMTAFPLSDRAGTKGTR